MRAEQSGAFVAPLRGRQRESGRFYITAMVAALGVVVIACIWLPTDEPAPVSGTPVPPLSITEHHIRTVAAGCKRFYKMNGFWPSNEVLILSTIPNANPLTLRDGWGHPFRFVVNGDDKSMTLYSLGKDGKLSGYGEDADATLVVK